MKLLAKLLLFISKVVRRILMVIFRDLFASAGRNFIFNPYDDFSYQNITVGNDVFIGSGAVFASSNSKILIGNKVMFGPNVSIFTGDHNTSVLGRYMYDVKEKLAENDAPVTIENDVWIGTRAIILKGVTIGSGSIIAAGSLVLKDVPPNSVVGGVPCKFLKFRFDEHQLLEHNRILSIKGNNSQY
ncbi:hypothetical protein GCM10009119_43210 [Algoriphagus jejuensis]|uniref:Uncharacterized protein n=1 Tax=Algoriphagus jejuensis TaxID=419934 RepID=A0ABN1N6E4_9BACT